ncbi:MAG TPA: MFS transporter [Kofleriaceae bacterium]|nr:MFS transporter [Kofleriaceae bacterium]
MFERSGLWGHRDFRRLWSAQAISAFGSRITRTALPIIAVKVLGEPESIVAVLAALQLAPGVVLAPFAGGFVDRSRKRRILVAADLFRAAVVASLTITWLFGLLAMTQVIVVGGLVGAASSLFQITDVAYLPSLIGKRHLAEGNAKLETTEAIAEITGPASAGALIAALGAPLAVIINTASYLWSALMLGRIRAVEPPPEPIPEAIATSGWQSRKDLRVGMRAVFGHPQVRPIVLALMVWSIAGGFFTALYALLCLRTLGLSEATFGVIIAMGGIGSLAGALISRPLVRAIGLGRALLVTSTISLAAGLLMPLARGSDPVVLGCLGAHQLIGDGCSVAFVIQAVTLRQTVLPRDVLGRANAAVLICTAGLVPVTALVAGALAQATSIRTAVWIGVSIGLAAPLCLLPLRRLREMPLAPADPAELKLATGA